MSNATRNSHEILRKTEPGMEPERVLSWMILVKCDMRT